MGFVKNLFNLKKEGNAEEIVPFDFVDRELPEKEISFVYKNFKKEIKDNMLLPELVTAFEKMCKTPIKAIDDVLLFETGIYDMLLFETGIYDSFLCFSLARQIQEEGNDEYVELRLDIQYKTDKIKKYPSKVTWSDEISGDFFEYVRNSDIYSLLKDEKIENLDIYMDGT